MLMWKRSFQADLDRAFNKLDAIANDQTEIIDIEDRLRDISGGCCIELCDNPIFGNKLKVSDKLVVWVRDVVLSQLEVKNPLFQVSLPEAELFVKDIKVGEQLMIELKSWEDVMCPPLLHQREMERILTRIENNALEKLKGMRQA